MKHNNLLLTVIGLLAGATAMQADDGKIEVLPSLPSYKTVNYGKRVTCHDPSIFIDNVTNPESPEYYIYGSHLGRGKTSTSTNYQDWTVFAAGEEAKTSANSLFAGLDGNLVHYSEAYSKHAVTKVKDKNGNEVDFGNFDAHKWQYTGYSIKGNEWAPDIVWNKTMGKWCMYMSVNGDKWASVIVCLTADKPTGPWIYQGPVVFSGFQGTYDHVGFGKIDDYKQTDLQIALGQLSALPTRYKVGSSWGSYWPNCIDPCVFYDDEDNLWMTYGSWSGGIFMLKLNPENGLRDYTYQYQYQVSGTTATTGSASANCTSDPYFGKKIAGGYYSSGEASYVQKIGKYYYLFMSYGELQSNGGYQMRVFRAEKPDGPYKDAYGNSAIYTSYQMNYSKTSATNRGQLLMGGYQWDSMSLPEIAQGHNSAITDHLGRSFVVYHTRFKDGGEGHQVRVHQLFQNQEGWLMAAPYEYSGETVTQQQIETAQLFTKEQVTGTYQIITHTYCQDTKNEAYKTPVTAVLNADGTVSGGYRGKWELVEGTSFINLTLGSIVYKGVLVEQTIDYTDIKALCIAGISASSGYYNNTASCTRGVELWASKADYAGAIRMTYDKLNIPISDNLMVVSDVKLPTQGKLGATIAWQSSNPSVMTDDGKIGENGRVTMKLSITKDGYAYVKEYHLTVNKDIPVNHPVVGEKDFSTPFLGKYSDAYTITKGETAKFSFVNHTDGVNNWDNWILVCSNDATHENKNFVLRADGWELLAGSGSGCTHNFNWSTFATDMEGALVDMIIAYTAEGKVVVNSTITTKAGKVYEYSYQYPKTLTASQIVISFSVEKAYLEAPQETGISEVMTDSRGGNHFAKGIFDLRGNRYSSQPVAKGIYIVDEKKVIVR